jgi:homospermidine synthase
MFRRRLVMLGFGGSGQGVLPLILRHIDIPLENISIVSSEERGRRLWRPPHHQAADLR